MTRVLVAMYLDWPLVAAGQPADVPAAVMTSGKVVAASAAARAARVVPGLRKRDAQSRCPDLVLLDADPVQEARRWEPVVAAVEELAPGLEVVGPGRLVVGTRGPSRYFGGDEAFAGQVVEVVRGVVTAGATPHVGVADCRFAAGLAARASQAGEPLVLAPGTTRVWLAGQPVQALGPRFEELTGLLVRLGLTTLGAFADLPTSSVLSRFGPEGVAALGRARGEEAASLTLRRVPSELQFTAELDPPEERPEAVAFVAKSLGADLEDRLGGEGLVATVVSLEMETEHGERLVRRWRMDGAFDAAGVAVRARWQLDGWQGGAGGAGRGDASGGDAGGGDAGGGGAAGGQPRIDRPTAGIILLRLIPEETHEGRQLDLLSGVLLAGGRPRDDVERAVARVQGLAGPEAVLVASPAGGRTFADQFRLLPWGASPPAPRDGPWPGRLSHPSPVVVHNPPLPAELLDVAGGPIEVSGRGVLGAVPVFFRMAGMPREEVVAWAGPWPVEERWWDAGGRRRARIQVLVAGGYAHLAYREAGEWWVEASYE